VAADGLAGGAADLAGAVGVDGQRPAHLVQHDVVMPPAPVLQAGQAGVAAVGAVHHVVRTNAGRTDGHTTMRDGRPHCARGSPDGAGKRLADADPGNDHGSGTVCASAAILRRSGTFSDYLITLQRSALGSAPTGVREVVVSSGAVPSRLRPKTSHPPSRLLANKNTALRE
jgi:hypothetical protein